LKNLVWKIYTKFHFFFKKKDIWWLNLIIILN
jgi:hypothetical protein